MPTLNLMTAMKKGSDHCPAMKGIETPENKEPTSAKTQRSDHCPAMKGIETRELTKCQPSLSIGSDHCPAMKGIETRKSGGGRYCRIRKRPLPRNEGD